MKPYNNQPGYCAPLGYKYSRASRIRFLEYAYVGLQNRDDGSEINYRMSVVTLANVNGGGYLEGPYGAQQHQGPQRDYSLPSRLPPPQDQPAAPALNPNQQRGKARRSLRPAGRYGRR